MKPRRKTSDDDCSDPDFVTSKKKAKTEESSKKHPKPSDKSHRSNSRRACKKYLAPKFQESVNITNNRLTRKLGVFATGKLSSKVWREYCNRDENRARANEDLNEIIRLADARNRGGEEPNNKRSPYSKRKAPHLVSQISPEVINAGVSTLQLSPGGRGVMTTAAVATTSKTVAARELTLKKHRQRKDADVERVVPPPPPTISNVSTKSSIFSKSDVTRRPSSRMRVMSSTSSCSTSEASSSPSMSERDFTRDFESPVKRVLKIGMEILFGVDDDYCKKISQDLEKLHIMQFNNNSQDSVASSNSISQPSFESLEHPGENNSPQPPRIKRAKFVPESTPTIAESAPFFDSSLFYPSRKQQEPTAFLSPEARCVPKQAAAGPSIQPRKGHTILRPAIPEMVAMHHQQTSAAGDEARLVNVNRAIEPCMTLRRRPLDQSVQSNLKRRADSWRQQRLPPMTTTNPKMISRPPPPPPSLSFPSQSVQNRRQMLLRLQDPSDKEILDDVDKIKLDTPQTVMNLTEASPDSDGVPTFLPRFLPAVRVPTRPNSVAAESNTPRYFRHKLY